jgi:release factor glutamine methyltransferase
MAQASVRSWLERGAASLAGHSDTARLDAEVLLAQVCGQARSHLIAFGERSLDAGSAERYQQLLWRRRQGEPLAYLTGKREFWSLPLQVSPAVLIPRPETELAVERALALLPAEAARIADLGTGSGAIALALAHERPCWQVLALDREPQALQVAQENARQLGLKQVQFVQGSWLEPLAARCLDLVVSNPPYVAADDPALAALRFEPAAALSPGSTGMEALQAILRQARRCLRPGGILVLEHGADQADRLARALVGAGYARVRCHRDLAGRERVTEAHWPAEGR